MNTDACSHISGADGVASIQCIIPLVVNTIKAVVSFGGIILFIILIMGGFTFLFSAGDPKKLERARGTITQAIVGIVIMSVAYLILLTIQSFTGVDVTNFTLPTN